MYYTITRKRGISLKKVYLLINSLGLGRGGLTKANLQQANLFSKLGYETSILTFNYDGDYKKIVEDIHSLYNLNKDVKIINMYDYFRNENKVIQKFNTYEDLINDDTIVERNDTKGTMKLYERGLYVKNVAFRNDKTLKIIDYFNNANYRIKTEYYALEGYIGKVSHMDYNLNAPRQMVFYNSIGDCYLRKVVNPENRLATKVDIIRNKEIVKSFKDDQQFKIHFVEEIIKENEESIIISDARNTDEILINVKNKNVKKYIRLHSNHLDANGNIVNMVKPAIENMKHIDSLIVLTEQQKNDIVNEFGYFEKITAIPHGITVTQPIEIDNETKENKAVIISRLVKLKQINHIIEAFNLIKNQIPDLILEIYGTGLELENLKKLVNKYGLESKISFQGYTDNPLEVYRKSLFSMTTSRTEGFSLGILESMSCGTPVISYDFKYGPNEIINNEEDGLIIKQNDINELSKKILHLYNNRDLLSNMSKKAIENTEAKFSVNKIENDWYKLLKQ